MSLGIWNLIIKITESNPAANRSPVYWSAIVGT